MQTIFGNAEGSASVDGVVLGVDTHLDLHVAVALDQLGRRLGELTVPTTTRGYERLLRWAEGFGPMGCAGIEGTSSYGAGLARHLKAAGVSVAEVERPKRRHLRRKGKSDPIDAEAAARAVLAGEALGEPKSGDGKVEMIRTLRSARQSAVKARTQAANQLQALLVTAPEMLRHRLRELPTKELVATCARFRPGNDPDNIETATRFALRSVARRHEALSEEITELDAQLNKATGGRSSPRADLPTRHRYSSRCYAPRGSRGQPGASAERDLVRQPLRGLAGRGLLGQGSPASA